MEYIIPKSEYDSAYAFIDVILHEPVEKIEFTKYVPTSSEIADSNKAFKGKLSMRLMAKTPLLNRYLMKLKRERSS